MALLDKNILSEDNKKDIEKVKRLIAKNDMEWTWRSIHKVIYKYEIDFESLKVYDDKFNNITILIECALPVGRDNFDEALDVLLEFTKEGIHPARLHRIFSDILQERHFFMGTPEEKKLMNLLEADKTDEITLRNLIYLAISIENAMKSYLKKKDD